MTLEKIKKYLTSQIKINFIEIYDNSSLHNYSKKKLTHLKIIIISNDFINEKIINRHRIVFSKLSKIIIEKIYSITLYTYTLNEWECKKYEIDNYSKCFKKK
ncbi:BolA family transcriptional regulator [Buchnera aphidicola (Hyperomyzus lactucae)]|uniref:BolA family transcriptional regulator n=1 Tax=Buchnera aphidicola (Hyperomyzus lactucae) TaxID=1241860 RepID=A0A4D6Y424_9GAMM|nr:BolA/IbaG family iron-sulfur metabolism protein [Buchnera aphidicola]QCI21184.1 BolA family transcriptional regulator [Buchnera aphidicola (Hyperomyzus lactucae)]